MASILRLPVQVVRKIVQEGQTPNNTLQRIAARWRFRINLNGHVWVARAEGWPLAGGERLRAFVEQKGGEI
jgi:hypothetical protein